MGYDERRIKEMKSIIITALMFSAVLLAIRFHVFDIMSSRYLHYIAFLLLIIVFVFALKVLGNPFQSKDHKNDKK